jgi:preprotein translocase subunit SecA
MPATISPTHQQRTRLRLSARQHEVRAQPDGPARPLLTPIVDEVDSILVDEARTPLIISGPLDDRSDLYNTIDAFIPKLIDVRLRDRREAALRQLLRGRHRKARKPAARRRPLKGDNLYDVENVAIVHHVNNALKAHKLFQRTRTISSATTRSSSSTNSPAA